MPSKQQYYDYGNKIKRFLLDDVQRNERYKARIQSASITILCTVPILLWVRDRIGSIYRVHGTSMEPTLFDGDYILVRKCEFGILPKAIYQMVTYSFSLFNQQLQNNNKDVAITLTHGDTTVRENNDSNHEDEDNNDRILLMNQNQRAPYPARLYDVPVLALPGNVVVLKHPNSPFYPTVYCVKRIIGVGGQWVNVAVRKRKECLQESQQEDPNLPILESKRQAAEDYSKQSSQVNDADNTGEQKEDKNATTVIRKNNIPTQSDLNVGTESRESVSATAGLPANNFKATRLPTQRWINLQPHTVYIEGDNHETSEKYLEPVSQNLIVGVAEYIIWPPTNRMFQRLHRRRESDQHLNGNNINARYEPRARW